MIVWNKLKSFIYGFLGVNILWYVLAIVVNSNVLLKPTVVYINIGNIIENGMYIHILASLNRIFMGLLVSFVIGTILGLLMAYSSMIDKLLSPIIYFTYPVPKLALLPVVMLTMGLGEASKITMTVLIIVFQVIVAIRDAVKNIPKETYNVFCSLGASRLQILRDITLPAILSEAFTSIRVTLGTALSVLFFTETYGTEKGMGFYIMDAWMRINYVEMYGGIVILSIMGFLLFMLVDIFEDIFCSWKR